MNEEQRTEFIRRLRSEHDDGTKRAFAQLLEDCATLKEDVRDLRRVIVGQKDYGQWGLTQRVDDHSRRIKQLERLGMFVAVAVTFLALFWDEIKRKLFS